MMPLGRVHVTQLVLIGILLVVLPAVAVLAEGSGRDAGLDPEAEPPSPPSLVRVYFQGRDELNSLAAELDIWEVHRDEGYVVAMVRSEQIADLHDQGYQVEVDLDETAEFQESLAPFEQPQEMAPVVARVPFATSQEANSLAAGLDVWDVNREEGYLVALLFPDEIQSLLDEGYLLELDIQRTRELQEAQAAIRQASELGPEEIHTIPGYSCYRTVEETYADLGALATKRPDLATWTDIGDSWEKVASGGTSGYDMYALVLTNQNLSGPKPKLLMGAAMHAREYTTAELATRFAEHLVANYGLDPEVTWLLDYYEFHLVPHLNPDGRKLAEKGLSWRKNTDNDDGCTISSRWGVDLNRNFGYAWNMGGSSGRPCDSTYRGPSASSEPETQAMQDYVLSLFPDRREPGIDDPAPLDYEGNFISLHSYGQDVLLPWRFDESPTPNATQITTLGRKYGYFTGYEVAVDNLYAASGNMLDYPYGELGVPGVTFELGTSFFQSCSYFETSIVDDLFETFTYALKATRRPYLDPAGPEALAVEVSPTVVAAGDPVKLGVTVDDTRYDSGGHGIEPVQSIQGARYTIDQPSWAAPPDSVQTANAFEAVPMEPADGAFDSPIESVWAIVDTSGLSPGRHILYVEGQDAGGNWGVPSAVFLEIEDPTANDLVSFAAVSHPDGVHVSWAAASEIRTLGYNLYRSEMEDGQRMRLNAVLIPVQLPGSPVGGAYEFLDATAPAGLRAYYWLESIELGGGRMMHGPAIAQPAGR